MFSPYHFPKYIAEAADSAKKKKRRAADASTRALGRASPGRAVGVGFDSRSGFWTDFGSFLDTFWGYLSLISRVSHKDPNLGADQRE